MHRQFIARNSLLDKSFVQESIYRGIYNCILVSLCLYLVYTPLARKSSKGEFFDYQLFYRISDDIVTCSLTWPLFYIWSHIAYLNCRFVHSNPSVQHISQALIFAYTAKMNLFVTHGIYMSFQACVFTMKMHSYTEVIRQTKSDVCIKDFTLYMWTPVLVYQRTYPRQQTRSMPYIVLKSLNCIFLITINYMIVSDHILPFVHYGFIQFLMQITLPVISVMFITFFMVFENYLNVFAEITKFSDRLFYFDWWNSNGIEDFNRKWNRPVHMFLHKHIYSEAIVHGFSKRTSQLITVTLSAMLHEFCLFVALKKVNPILLSSMIFQIPLFWLTKYFSFMNTNLFTWFSILFGVPLLTVFYFQ